MEFYSKNSNGKRLERALELEYKKFCNEFGYDFEEIMSACKRRLSEARAKNIKDLLFFRAELEALGEFRQKVLKRKKDEEKDDSVPKLDYEGGADKILSDDDEKSSFRCQVYPSIPIHQDVPKEMEHFFGALVELRKEVMPSLKNSVELIRDKSYRSQISEIEALFDDLADYEEMRDFPLVFNTYLVKVQNGAGNSDVVDRASIEVYKMVVVLVKKIKKVLMWLQHPRARVTADVSVIYEGEPLLIGDFARKVGKRFSDFLEVFGLERF